MREASHLRAPNYMVGSYAPRQPLGHLECQGDPWQWNGCFFKTKKLNVDAYSTMLPRYAHCHC